MGVTTEVVSPSSLSPTTVFCSLILSTIVFIYIYWRISRRALYEAGLKIPGPAGVPLLGNVFEFLGNAEDIGIRLRALGEKYDTIMRLWLGPKLIIFLADPRDMELVLNSNVHLNKAPEYQFFKPWLGDGLLISSGNKWRSHRKLIAPTFHLNVLKSFVDLFNANSRAVCERMSKENGKEFDCHDYMSECTVEILLETAMGVNKSTSGNSGFEYALAVMKMCDILHLRQSKFWLRPNWVFQLSNYAKDQVRYLNIIHGLTRKVIQKRKKEFDEGNKHYVTSVTTDDEKKKVSSMAISSPRDDLDEQDDNDVGQKKRMAFLDLMLETQQNGAEITDEELKEEVDTIMFEGHDTTAAASSFFLCLMGVHQQYQELCWQELNQIFGDSDRPATFADTLEMKFLERCILETLRLYPPVPAIARELQEDLRLASMDAVLPKGTTVVLTIVKTHRLPEFYPDPETYDPDRHLPEKAAQRPYYSFVPFSAGPRSCVGRKYALLKLKILLSTILRRYKVHGDIPEKDFRFRGDIILKREDGFRIRLEPRKKTTTFS